MEAQDQNKSMPIKMTAEDGTEVDVPVDKVEDITPAIEASRRVADLETQLAAAKKAEHPEWPATRQLIDKLNEEIATLKKTPHGTPPPAPLDESKATEIAAQKAKEAIDANNATTVDKKRDKLMDELASGDDNKKKVIKEKYEMLTGGRKITDEDEMKAFLSDANLLANKGKQAAGAPFANMGGGSAGGPPNRAAGKANMERGNELASGFGYRPKSDVSKLLNK